MDTDCYYRKELYGELDKVVDKCCGNSDDKADVGRDFVCTAHTTGGTSHNYE